MRNPTPADVDLVRTVQKNYLEIHEALQKPMTPGGDTVDMTYLQLVVDACAWTLALRGYEQNTDRVWLRRLPDGSYVHLNEPDPPPVGDSSTSELWTVTPKVTIEDEEPSQ
ncbi:MAG TPA: hypothetical protein VJ777_23740 [Mycobacterium sp.]|nr:hypothetical protein [Mycobacterium sp.]